MLLPLLRQYAADLFGLELSEQQIEQFTIYAHQMLDWNATKANLTAITDLHMVEIRHFLDSLSLLLLDIPLGARVIDVGSGAGLPGVALQIARPDLRVSLLESVGKKTTFLKHIVSHLGYSTEVIHGRAEEIGQNVHFRARFDIAVARSVAYLPSLVEYLLPLCKVGGVAVAMKGANPEQEISEATEAIHHLGGKLQQVLTIELPEVAQSHTLIVIEKIKNTPKMYPRRPGIPTKHPISSSA